MVGNDSIGSLLKNPAIGPLNHKSNGYDYLREKRADCNLHDACSKVKQKMVRCYPYCRFSNASSCLSILHPQTRLSFRFAAHGKRYSCLVAAIRLCEYVALVHTAIAHPHAANGKSDSTILGTRAMLSPPIIAASRKPNAARFWHIEPYDVIK